MSRHPAQELKETVQETQIPSTEQITKGIESTKEAIHAELDKRSPIASEQKVGKDTEQFLETSKQFIEEKNKGDIVQKLIYDANKAVDELTELFQKHPFFIEKHKALLAKQEALDLGSMAKQNLKLMRDLLITLVQSSEFRGLLQDFVKLVKATYTKETSGLPTMKPESGTMTGLKDEAKEKGMQTFEVAKQVYTDYKEGTVVPEEHKQQVKQQFISLIKTMAKDENYVNSINGIFQILDQAQFLAQRVKDEAQGQLQEIQTPSLNAMWSDSKTFLINFSGEGAVDVMIADYNDLYDTISTDTLLMNFISDFKNFVIDALKNPSMVDSEEFNTRYEDLYQRGQGYINDTRYQQKFHKLYNDVIVLLECIKTDTATQQLASDATKLARDLFLDEQGRPSLNIMSSGLTNLRSLVAPILKKNLENVPILGMSGEDDTYKWRIDQLTLNMSELVPDNIEMKVWGAANVSIATTKAEAVTYITMWIKNVGVEAKNLKFAFQRKSFPKIEEEGVADFSVTGRNQLKITWKVLGLQDEPWTFSIHEVKCLLDNVDIKIKESTHTFLMKMMTSLFSGTIRRNIEHKIEQNISEGLTTVNSQLNAAVKA